MPEHAQRIAQLIGAPPPVFTNMETATPRFSPGKPAAPRPSDLGTVRAWASAMAFRRHRDNAKALSNARLYVPNAMFRRIVGENTTLLDARSIAIINTFVQRMPVPGMPSIVTVDLDVFQEPTGMGHTLLQLELNFDTLRWKRKRTQRGCRRIANK